MLPHSGVFRARHSAPYQSPYSGVVEGPPLGLGFRVGVGVGVGFGFGCRAVSFAYALTRQLALQETASACARRSDPQARR